MNFDDFLSNQSIRNQWITERNIRVYMRRAFHVIDGTMKKCLDVGSVEVSERHRGKGIFTSFLNRVELAAKELEITVFVENILNDKLSQFLLRNGYKKVPESNDIVPCVYKDL